MNDRLRTVSRLPAFTYAACWTGVFSASSTISHCEPVQAPCAPSASAAAICWPLPMPPAASTGTGATSLTTCGHSTIEPTSPQCPPASPPWAMMMSTPASACLRAWLGDPHSAATVRPSAWMCSIMSLGGVPRALAISVIFGCLRATSTCGVAVASVQPSSCRVLSSSSSVERHAVVGQDLAGEVEVFLRDHVSQHLRQFVGGQIRVHALVLVGDDDVDAVVVVADVLVDPVAFDLELLRGEAHRAEHTETSGLAHRDHHVAAVGEGEDRELDAELVAQGSMHGPLLGLPKGTKIEN